MNKRYLLLAALQMILPVGGSKRGVIETAQNNNVIASITYLISAFNLHDGTTIVFSADALDGIFENTDNTLSDIINSLVVVDIATGRSQLYIEGDNT